MAQQPQQTAQAVFGPANGGGDILHFAAGNAIAPNGFLGWIDNNGMQAGAVGVFNALTAGAALALTASAGGIFSNAAGNQCQVALPGNSAYEQVPFVVKASGTVQLPAGTYTATVQPLVYASTFGFTAAAANAIYSVAAASLTITSASASNASWEIEAHLNGDSVSGKLVGWQTGSTFVTGTALTPTLITLVASPSSNAPTGLVFTSATPPIAFAAGVTFGGGAPSVKATLGALFIA